MIHLTCAEHMQQLTEDCHWPIVAVHACVTMSARDNLLILHVCYKCV